MTTLIPCNELSQVALELQMKFKNCTTLSANDLDTMIDLIMSLQGCINNVELNVSNTSDLINDGEFGLSTFIENSDLDSLDTSCLFGNIAFSPGEKYNASLSQILQVIINKLCACDCTGGTTNISPIVNAGQNVIMTLPDNSVTLTANASDTDGTIVSYLWTQVSGPNVTITNPTSIFININSLVVGTYVFQVVVTDDGGLTSSDTVVVKVLPTIKEPIPPISNAGSNQSLNFIDNNEINSTTIDGGLSYDPDGTVVSYLWTQVSGPSSQIGNNTQIVATIVPSIPGIYVYNLLVIDNDGLQDNSLVSVEFVDEPMILYSIEVSASTCNEEWKNVKIAFVLAPPNSLPNILSNGVKIYADEQLTEPLLANRLWRYRGVFPSQQIPTHKFFVSTTGNIYNYTECEILPINQHINRDYNGSSLLQGDEAPLGSVFTLPSSLITDIYTGAEVIDHILITNYPTIGDLGVQLLRVDEAVLQMNVPIQNIIDGDFAFWCRGLTDSNGNTQKNNGSFITTFSYDIISTTGTVLVENTTITIVANSI